MDIKMSIPIRQPLASMTINKEFSDLFRRSPEMGQLVLEETNVKKAILDDGTEVKKKKTF